MELTRERVEAAAEAYAAEEPLFAVEDEQLEGLPGAFVADEYGWRDAEWVVRWHFRRHLGSYPDDRRRAAEDAFGENDFEAVREAITAALAADEVGAAVDALTDLHGVDVPVASAFLQFLDPARFVVVGEREWGVLHDAGELDGPYPDPPAAGDYRGYLAACRDVADRLGVAPVTFHRALWRLGDGA